MPDLALDERCQDDLELLLAGVGDGFGGADGGSSGFGGGDGDSGGFMTVPAAEGLAGVGEAVRLVDAEGAPLAELTVREVVTVPGQANSGEFSAEGPISTHDARTKHVQLSGPVRELARRVARPFEELYRPLEAGVDRVVVPADAPLPMSALEAVATAASGRPVAIAALVGAGSPRGLSAVGLIHATLAAAELLRERGTAVEVVAVPVTGGSHVEDALAVYAPGQVRWPENTGPVPDRVMRSIPRPARTGVVVLLTGLSGSGKSTIARGLRNALLESGAPAVTLLDGDVVRRHLSAGLGFSRADRETNVARIGWVAAEISRHGGIAIASPIAPFAATRAAVRDMVREAGGAYLLVHVATPLAECERRDRKGLYARARAGQIPDFTGISSPYEEPHDADLTIDTTSMSVPVAVDQVWAELHQRGLLPEPRRRAAPGTRASSASGRQGGNARGDRPGPDDASRDASRHIGSAEGEPRDGAGSVINRAPDTSAKGATDKDMRR